MEDYFWVGELASEARLHVQELGSFLSEAISKISFSPVAPGDRRRAILLLVRDIVQTDSERLDESFEAARTIGADWLSNESLSAEAIKPYLTLVLSNIFDGICLNSRRLHYLEDYDVLTEIISALGLKYAPLFQFLPLLAAEASTLIPHLREPLFSSLFELPEDDHRNLAKLSKKILTSYYNFSLRPRLENLFSHHTKGQRLLLPMVDEIIKTLPPEKCFTTVVQLMCTPKEELSQGRIISIILQELGGLYVKLAQVLSEIAPASLARELRQQQDQLGGIFGSQEKSWDYILEIFNRPEWIRLRPYFVIPETPLSSFAGASVGAIYEFNLTDLGKRRLQTDHPILIKIQRPGLVELFQEQRNTLLSMIEKIELHIDGDASDLREISSALRRSIENYADQSLNELDFRREKRNADLVREALKGKEKLRIPRYFHVDADVLMMEKVTGTKVTSIVNSRYLERMMIADAISEAYLYLMFKKGIIWADPHAGNILYDPDRHEISLIDLSPCFKWEHQTTKMFVGFIYRLILRDDKGILLGLEDLIEDKDILRFPENRIRVKNFVQSGSSGNFMHFLSDFVKLLGESDIHFRIEVQAAFRGITQVYLTVNAISSRHHFGPIFQEQFGWQMLLTQIMTIGPFKATRATLPIAFDILRNSPDEEIGPTVDERDIEGLEKALVELREDYVCNIELKRKGPEENPRLILTTDGSRLVRSAHLEIAILSNARPASVLYLLEIPSKEWLRERQEYIKLQGLGFSLCLVECLEQLRRHSLENYWHVVESWNFPVKRRGPRENALIFEVRFSARVLFHRRFKNLWKTDLMNVSLLRRFCWNLQNWLETRIEKNERNYYRFLAKKIGQEKVGLYAAGTIHRLRIILYRLLIQPIKAYLRRSKFELNLLPLSTSELIDRMIHGLLRNRQ